MAAPKLSQGDTVQLSIPESGDPPTIAHVASIHDAGIVLTRSVDSDGHELGQGSKIRLVVASGMSALQTHGVVAGSSAAGIAVQLKEAWRPLERREFPRADACIPMRYRILDEESEARVSGAIRSKISSRGSSRPKDAPYDKSEMASVNSRLMKIERTLELLTDLVLWAGTSQSALSEREVEISASGLAFRPDRSEEFDELVAGAKIELELLLPLRDPVRVRSTAIVVRHVTERGRKGVACKYDCIDESDQDEIARYVFQLQRRRQAFP